METRDRIWQGGKIRSGPDANSSHAEHHIVFNQPNIHLIVHRIGHPRSADEDPVRTRVPHHIVRYPMPVHLYPDRVAVRTNHLTVANNHLARTV